MALTLLQLKRSMSFINVKKNGCDIPSSLTSFSSESILHVQLEIPLRRVHISSSLSRSPVSEYQAPGGYIWELSLRIVADASNELSLSFTGSRSDMSNGSEGRILHPHRIPD